MEELWEQLLDQSNRKTVVIHGAEKLVVDSEHYSGRPVLGKIVVLPMSALPDFKPDKPWAAISITDADMKFPPISEENRVGLLQLDFDDIEFQRPSKRCISKDQSAKIWNFVAETWPKVQLMMVHCHAGISRSPAVAQTISRYYQPKYVEFYNQLYSPNKLVIDEMLSVLVN